MKRLSLILGLLFTLPLWAGRSFNGTSDVIAIPSTGNALDISTGPETISLWMYPTTIPGTTSHYPVSNYGASSGQFAVGFGACGGSCSAAGVMGYVIGTFAPETGVFGGCGTGYTANKWYQVILYADPSGTVTGGMHVSGGLSCSTSTAWIENRVAGTGKFDIGGLNGAANFQGTVAEVAVWNTLLTSAQMTALQTVCPVGGSARRMSLPKPVGYFPLWGAASPEPDLSGHKLNGTLTGTAQANHAPCTQ
jgi:Concanavalin A-like lectin/glucanases superfamily